MLRTKNLIQKVNNTTQYNTAVQQIGGIQRARYKVLNDEYQRSAELSESLRDGNYFIYSTLYDLYREVLILEAHITNYRNVTTVSCNSTCDGCQTAFSTI